MRPVHEVPTWFGFFSIPYWTKIGPHYSVQLPRTFISYLEEANAPEEVREQVREINRTIRKGLL